MGLRDQLRRLRREAEGELIVVPQRYGPPARFPKADLADAFVSAIRRSAGIPAPDHPLSVAARNSSDPDWSGSLVAAGAEIGPHVEDLSEP